MKNRGHIYRAMALQALEDAVCSSLIHIPEIAAQDFALALLLEDMAISEELEEGGRQ